MGNAPWTHGVALMTTRVSGMGHLWQITMTLSGVPNKPNTPDAHKRGRRHADNIGWQYGLRILSRFAGSYGTPTEKRMWQLHHSGQHPSNEQVH